MKKINSHLHVIEKKYYLLGVDNERIVIELIKKCKELQLGNISFDLYDKRKGEVKFYIIGNATRWELRVRCYARKLTVDEGYIHYDVIDTYRIIRNKLIYENTKRN